MLPGNPADVKCAVLNRFEPRTALHAGARRPAAAAGRCARVGDVWCALLHCMRFKAPLVPCMAAAMVARLQE